MSLPRHLLLLLCCFTAVGTDKCCITAIRWTYLRVQTIYNSTPNDPIHNIFSHSLTQTQLPGLVQNLPTVQHLSSPDMSSVTSRSYTDMSIQVSLGSVQHHLHSFRLPCIYDHANECQKSFLFHADILMNSKTVLLWFFLHSHHLVVSLHSLTSFSI